MHGKPVCVIDGPDVIVRRKTKTDNDTSRIHTYINGNRCSVYCRKSTKKLPDQLVRTERRELFDSRSKNFVVRLKFRFREQLDP